MAYEPNDNNNDVNHLLNLLQDGKDEMNRLSTQLNGPQHTSAMRVQSIFDEVMTVFRRMDPSGMRHTVLSGSPGKSGSGSERSEGSERTIRKRKDVVKRTIQVPAPAPNNGPLDAISVPEDGYSWRKYGQKNILNAKYPRSYYRCTFQKNQNCQAYKHVQRSDEDPSLCIVTYIGEHTCAQQVGQTSLAPSLDHQLLMQNNSDEQCMIEFDKPYTTIETHESCHDEQGKIHSPSFSISSAQVVMRSENPNVFSPSNSFGGPFSSGFVPSGASDSNYHLSMFQSEFTGDFGGVSSFHGLEYGLNDVISMPHSGTSTPYGFNIEQPPYPFDSQHPFK